MASASVEEELECPICTEFLRDPVTLDCGHNFCRGCITNYCEIWEDLGDLECPLCKAKIKKGNFRPNFSLANIVEKIKLLLLNPGKGDLCVKHMEKLHLFCKEDKKFVCLFCERSPEHRSHTILLLEEAAEEYKLQFPRYLRLLKKKREDIRSNKETTEKESRDLLQQTKTEREKTLALFSQLHAFLEVQKKLLLAQMEEVEEEISTRRDEHIDKLSEELVSLESIIQQMEEKLQQPARELLQDIGDTLQRCEMRKEFENPKAFPLELKWRFWDVCDLSPFLDGVTKQFKDTVVSGCPMQKANVTLDPDTANPHLILSEDCKSVKWGESAQNVQDNLKRFDVGSVVLGREGFTAGRHFWEVMVGTEEIWTVGVARQSVRRKDLYYSTPAEGVWTVGLWGGKHKASIPLDCPPLSLSGKLKKIRVTLNCAGRQVAFYDADTAGLLYLYSEISEETFFPFFYVRGKAHLQLCH
ncbi:tripartite motif-containing protein 10-like [Tiliqua scincoides]|uniref:tripartite motif-containing protein 10-like n=1 Tax=Tiliqua scincoides TaxID=71010 RepID=UPI003462E79B